MDNYYFLEFDNSDLQDFEDIFMLLSLTIVIY